VTKGNDDMVVSMNPAWHQSPNAPIGREGDTADSSLPVKSEDQREER